MVGRLGIVVALLTTGIGVGSTQAQDPSALARERADYREWLAAAPTSPLAAIAQQPI